MAGYNENQRSGRSTGEGRPGSYTNNFRRKCKMKKGEESSTSATEIEGNEPLGTLAGKGYASNKQGGHIQLK